MRVIRSRLTSLICLGHIISGVNSQELICIRNYRIYTKKLVYYLFFKINGVAMASQPSNNRYMLLSSISSMLLLFGLSGCITVHSPTSSTTTSSHPTAQDTLYSSALSEESEQEDSFDRYDISQVDSSSTVSLSRQDLLYREAKIWQGTPHQWGGTSRSGIDCSALVQAIYSDAFEISLPRTTRDQSRIGKRVPRSKLKVGDLIFYKINSRTRHVGIYMGNDSFVHSSKSEGVAISPLDTPYWARRYWMARRILPVDETGLSNSPSPSASGSRISW